MFLPENLKWENTMPETRAVESESEGILGGVRVGKIVPTLTPTPTSV
jgi:hypothetical protein